VSLRLGALVLLVGTVASAAEPRRVAVIVGANRGALGRDSLRYSYRDAQQMADVLVQVGQFAPADVHVLQDPEPDDVVALLDQQLSALAATSGESMLLFYYSGHADTGALYPGGKALPFGSLRARLDNRAATVRIGIIDACSGGGWTGAKELRPAPPFVVDVPLELSGEGSVLIASSSGVEQAHESERLLGSFFTHHLVAGLRGAADPRGAGVVTVADAFAYAKERTVRDTAAVSTEPQHPSFFMNLRGRADLPLARVASSSTLMELEENEGPLQVIHLGTGLVLLEVPAGRRTVKLSVPAGRYLVRRRSERGTWTQEIGVDSGRTVVVREQDLALSGFGPAASKGLLGPQAFNDPRAVRSTGVGPRTELVITSTIAGLYLSGITAAAANANDKGTVGLLMLGTGGALVGSILATSDREVPQSMPQMLENGVGFGSFATLLVLTVSGYTGNTAAVGGEIALGAALGGAGGLIASPWLTGGDSGAMSTGIIYGALLPLMVHGIITPAKGNSASWTGLIGSTAGLIAGPLLNRSLGWSRGRWNLITLGGGVGGLMGAGLGVLTDSFNGNGRGGLALVALGTVAGLGLTAWATQDFGADEARPGAASLLHLEDGKLSLGDPLTALAPLRVDGRTGASLRLFGGRF
jgi:hypothetical protein